MKRHYLFLITFMSAVLSYAQPEGYEPLSEHVSFQITFDGTFDVQRARGNPKLRGRPLVPTDYAFVPGVSGQAIMNVTSNTLSWHFGDEGNIDYASPGTVSFWSQIRDVTGTPPFKEGGFFLSAYCRTGYMTLQGAGKDEQTGLRSLIVYFIGFEGMGRPVCRARNLAWPEDEWVNIVLAWDGISFSLFFNGEYAGNAMLPRKMRREEMSRNFVVVFPHSGLVAMDEFTVYDIRLTSEQIRRLYISVLDGS